MNKDQADRWAEEVELPELLSTDHPDVIGGVGWSEMEMEAIKKYAREAIAAALVKLTEGQK